MTNVTGWHSQIESECWPTSVEEVVRIVVAASADKRSIYPVSTGLNWGYGSASPPMPGCTLIRLDRMNRILNADSISVDNPVAVIEPGVTQRQLHAFLAKRCPELMFNVTGAAADTSIIGNALDGGIGYLGSRRADLFGLEAVLGDGTILQTGFRRLGGTSPLAHTHPDGVGPSLDGLFFQGNFGIVTSACFRLLPRPPKQVALSIALHREEFLADLLQTLLRLKREGVLTSVTHLGNKARTHSTLAPGVAKYLVGSSGIQVAASRLQASAILSRFSPQEWTGLATVFGTPAQVAATVTEVKRRLRHIARVTPLGRTPIRFLHSAAHRMRRLPFARSLAALTSAIDPLHGLAMGVPTDAPVEGLLWSAGQPDMAAAELDRSQCGLLYVCPALPPDGRAAARVLAELKSVAGRFDFALPVTINVVSDTALVAIANLTFDRSDASRLEGAHRCARALLDKLHALGLEVYRARADMMETLSQRNPGHWSTVNRLKQALDPAEIVAPGRYGASRARP